jgi:hypothetical protein
VRSASVSACTIGLSSANQEDTHRFSLRGICHAEIHPIALNLKGTSLDNLPNHH